MHYDDSGHAPAKQPVRTRRITVRILGFHPSMEHVRGTDSARQTAHHDSILRSSMAHLHQIVQLQTEAPDPSDALLDFLMAMI